MVLQLQVVDTTPHYSGIRVLHVVSVRRVIIVVDGLRVVVYRARMEGDWLGIWLGIMVLQEVVYSGG